MDATRASWHFFDPEKLVKKGSKVVITAFLSNFEGHEPALLWRRPRPCFPSQRKKLFFEKVFAAEIWQEPISVPDCWQPKRQTFPKIHPTMPDFSVLEAGGASIFTPQLDTFSVTSSLRLRASASLAEIELIPPWALFDPSALTDLNSAPFGEKSPSRNTPESGVAM
eukprot:s1718_g3.t1